MENRWLPTLLLAPYLIQSRILCPVVLSSSRRR